MCALHGLLRQVSVCTHVHVFVTGTWPKEGGEEGDGVREGGSKGERGEGACVCACVSLCLSVSITDQHHQHLIRR